MMVTRSLPTGLIAEPRRNNENACKAGLHAFYPHFPTGWPMARRNLPGIMKSDPGRRLPA
jgi:hypothetical protein